MGGDNKNSMNTDTSKQEPESTLEAETPQGQETQGTTEESSKNEAPSREKELEAKCQEAEKKYLYLYSEFENFRRRNERDRADFLKFGHEGFLRDLLQVLDNFERAVAHAKSFEIEKGSPLFQVNQGVEMIHFQLLESMKAQGVTPIQTTGAKFDPALHEAVGEEESDVETGTILKELQRGYTLHGRLLRAAKVIVAKQKVS